MYNKGDIIEYKKIKKKVGYVLGYYNGKFIVRNIIERKQERVAIEEITKYIQKDKMEMKK